MLKLEKPSWDSQVSALRPKHSSWGPEAAAKIPTVACGLFIAAIHQMGLATLTHTPSPMAFLTKLLERPRNEWPFALLPIGYPAADCEVPDITRKDLNQVMIEFSGEDDPA